jgi:hypothetical protein
MDPKMIKVLLRVATPAAVGHALGNTMSLNVLERILGRLVCTACSLANSFVSSVDVCC